MYPLKHLKDRKPNNMFKKRSDQKDEACKLLENLDNKNIYMDKEFSKKLKSDILSQYEHENVFMYLINFVKRSLSMPSLKFNKLPVISASTISLILISFYGLITYFVLNNYHNNLSQNDKNEVLSKILQNNSGSVLKSSKNPSELFSVSQAVAAELSNGETRDETATDASSTIAPIYYNDNYNFFHYTSTYTLGPAAASCPAYGDSENSYSRIETYDFQNYSENSYYPKYKYLAYNNNDELVDYSLSSDKYRYEYKGGTFALRFEENYDYLAVTPDSTSVNTEILETSPSSTKTLSDTEVLVDEAGTTSENTGINVETETIELIPEAKDVIPYYFGEDSEVEEVTIEGKKYYLVIYSYDTPCSYNEERSKNPTISSETTSLEAENTKTLFFKDLYETDTYSLVKQEVYLASISDNNLISSSEYVVEKAEKTISEVSSLFTFDLNVNVKNVPTTAYNENSYYPYEKDVIKQSSYLTYLKNFLQQKDIEIFTPSNETYVLFETSISDYYDPTKPYYTNRNFYPNNDFGQKQYEDYLALYESLSYNQKFTTTYILKDETERSQDPGFYQISAYDKNLDVSDFSEYFFGTNQYTFKDSISLKINNETVSATKYTYNYQAGVEDITILLFLIMNLINT
ncbi:MAG: hypothetical protein UR87_C0061G0003 [candidate division CPR3 bacterium GW2011_GWE2_35_7]|nr:MAG: hypothetical protein UR87_C0061G0003 [candidate division CPR3 bacterium GW2011_GWE2_35_7]